MTARNGGACPADKISFSLITATLGRDRELIPLLESLRTQTFTGFELIIVDQNEDDRVKTVIKPYLSLFAINYIKSAQKGLSHNRNLGLESAAKKIIAFPDDDCEYENDTLKKCADFFKENGSNYFYACNTKEKNGNRSFFNGLSGDHPITKINCTFTVCSPTLFVPGAAFSTFRFDEQLGVGAVYGSGEETDLVYHLLRNGYKGRYFGGRYIFHPYKEENAGRVSYYASGFGAVYHKAVFCYGFWSLFFLFWARIAKNILNILIKPGRRQTFLALKGRVSGFFSYRKKGRQPES
jgi:glycosyltransferase involved in cell wall biosynthesis